ncbi:E3 SUMO-protein ligase PIAS2 isoform X2 [Zootermopsis nevadensis]|uniref:E3 SUMO-protein ligase PIAS2 isoform X2 n=1 Tax=Zootermopsis nevadensis TaxID=136037 RepID=UPI000B8E5C65|nr:E3 SUMO-protein ligase PIAS2 isoform X2 [Zootermopsis nevadensis]
MAETEALKNMVLSFRVSELQMLLGFAGRNKSGRKTELQARAVELLRLRSTPVQMKIKDLYKSIQQGQASGLGPVQQQTNPATAASAPSAPSSAASRDLQAAHNNTMQQHTQPQQRNVVYQQAAYTGQSSDRQIQPPRSMYPGNMYQYQPKASPPASAASNYPVHPDVRFKHLPFFDLMGELLKPSSLVPQGTQRLQEGNFVFHLTPQQATDIASSRDLRPGTKMEYAIQVQMRFCLLETSCEQDDFFPPGICVKVNGKMCPLPNPIPTNKPGVEPKRPPRPVNITTMVKLSPTVANHITVSWNTEYGRGYAIAVYLVRKLTSSELLQRLKTRGVRHSDFTRGLIKEKLAEDADCEIATTSLRVSLVCPLGKMRMSTPCRASTCYHLQCFDASLYLQMNERKPTWMCPVCDKPALYDNLVIDGYFQQVLLSGKLSTDGNEIQLHQDGSWSSLIVKKEQTRVLSPVPQEKPVVKIETLSDELEVIQPPRKEEPKKKATVIDLTLSDSEDEAEAPVKTNATNKPDSSNQAVNSSSGSGIHSDTSVSSSGGSAGGNNSNPGLSSVSSSGYMSPSVITLDSPSPPATPTPPAPAVPPVQPLPGRSPGLRMPPPIFPNSMYLSSVPTFLDLDSDSNSPQSSNAGPLYPPRY